MDGEGCRCRTASDDEDNNYQLKSHGDVSPPEERSGMTSLASRQKNVNPHICMCARTTVLRFP